MNVKKILKAPLICGQPTDETHPHIVKKGEVSTCTFQKTNRIKCSCLNMLIDYVLAGPWNSKKRVYD